MCHHRSEMPTLYDILGVAEDATDEEVRRAYLRAARRMHPDVNPGVDTTEDMRDLNRAWSVLGRSGTRRTYDRELHERAGAGAATATTPEPDCDDVLPPHPFARLLRPSALIVAVMLLVFVVTAYAGPNGSDRSGPPASTATTSVSDTTAPGGAAADLVGECLKLLPGYDAVVPCIQANDGVVVGEVAASSDCPAVTRPYQLAGHTQIVCLARSGS